MVPNWSIDALSVCPPERRKLSLRTARHASKEAAVSISDTGPGIPEVILPRLFEPTVSTKKSAARAGTRSGVGLHIVATIVEKYAGRVSAANRERRSGAVFTIELPALR